MYFQILQIYNLHGVGNPSHDLFKRINTCSFFLRIERSRTYENVLFLHTLNTTGMVLNQQTTRIFKTSYQTMHSIHRILKCDFYFVLDILGFQNLCA